MILPENFCLLSSYTVKFSNRMPMLTPHPTMTICLLEDLVWISLIETNNVQVVGCVCAAYDPMSPLWSLLWRIPYPVPDWKDGHDGISSKTIWLVCYSWFQLRISSSTCVIQKFCENSCIKAIIVQDTLTLCCLLTDACKIWFASSAFLCCGSLDVMHSPC